MNLSTLGIYYNVDTTGKITDIKSNGEYTIEYSFNNQTYTKTTKMRKVANLGLRRHIFMYPFIINRGYLDEIPKVGQKVYLRLNEAKPDNFIEVADSIAECRENGIQAVSNTSPNMLEILTFVAYIGLVIIGVLLLVKSTSDLNTMPLIVCLGLILALIPVSVLMALFIRDCKLAEDCNTGIKGIVHSRASADSINNSFIYVYDFVIDGVKYRACTFEPTDVKARAGEEVELLINTNKKSQILHRRY